MKGILTDKELEHLKQIDPNRCTDWHGNECFMVPTSTLQSMYKHIEVSAEYKEILTKCLTELRDDDLRCKCEEAWTGRDLHEPHCMDYCITYINRALAGIHETCPCCKQQGFHKMDCETNDVSHKPVSDK